ncbi:MAG: hypothetical protein IKS10_00075 [Lachnospiraceae bacterium]|nr:hypothetical protein [Lachnospiraceae bacterium]
MEKGRKPWKNKKQKDANLVKKMKKEGDKIKNVCYNVRKGGNYLKISDVME